MSNIQIPNKIDLYEERNLNVDFWENYTNKSLLFKLKYAAKFPLMNTYI